MSLQLVNQLEQQLTPNLKTANIEFLCTKHSVEWSDYTESFGRALEPKPLSA